MSISLDPVQYFKNAGIIYSKIKRDLGSFDTANLIDEGEFPTYIAEVLRHLKLGVYKEKDVILKVKNYKASLPEDFSKAYAVYKCSPYIDLTERRHQQGAPMSFYNDITWEILQPTEDCEFKPEKKNEILEHVEIRQFIHEKPVNYGFSKFILLRPSPNIKKDFLGEDCRNALSSSELEFSIVNKCVHTNFSQDWVYVQYYAFPQDKNGVPEIPDIIEVEKAIEWYIKYQLLMNMWLNNSVPDLQNRWQYAEQQYGYWAMEAKKHLQTPSFSQMVNNIRRDRNINKINIFTPHYL